MDDSRAHFEGPLPFAAARQLARTLSDEHLDEGLAHANAHSRGHASLDLDRRRTAHRWDIHAAAFAFEVSQRARNSHIRLIARAKAAASELLDLGDYSDDRPPEDHFGDAMKAGVDVIADLIAALGKTEREAK